MKLKLTGSSIRCNGQQHRPPAVIDTEVLGISDAEAMVLVRRGVAVHYDEPAKAALAAEAAPSGAEVIKLELGKADESPAAEQEGTLAGVVDEAGDVVSLSKMKKDELLQIAKDMEIEGADGMKKDDLIAAIEAQKVLVPAEGGEQDDAGAEGKDPENAGAE